MKTMNAILGSALVILGVVSLGGFAIVGAGTCAKTMAAAALLHVPTCDQTTATILVLLLLGIAFLIVGAVLLLRGRERQATTTQVTTSPVSSVYCRQCGKEMPSGSLFCDRCGTKVA